MSCSDNSIWDVGWKETPRKKDSKTEDYIEDKDLEEEHEQIKNLTKQALDKGNSWIRASKYAIREFPLKATIGGEVVTAFSIKIIVPEKDAVAINYKPFEVKCSLQKPEKDISEEQHWGPHLHLMRLDLESEEEILDYVHQWGLMGLWNEDRYKDLKPTATLLPVKQESWYRIRGCKKLRIKKHKKILVKAGFKIKLSSNSRLKLPFNSRLKLPVDYKLRWCEPLEFFKKAALDFQSMVAALAEGYEGEGKQPLGDEQDDANIRLVGTLENVSPYTWIENGKGELAWNFDSLYKAIFLMTALDWTSSNQGYRLCANAICNKPFLPRTDRDKYCSRACGVNQRRNKNYHEVEKPKIIFKEVYRLFPGIDQDWLKVQIENLLTKRGIGPKKAVKKIVEIIKEQ